MESSMLSGLGNHFSTEARPGALPSNQNSPQVAPLGLYAEQLSGSAFTAPRHSNLSSWLYRIQPSVTQGRFKPLEALTQQTLFKPTHVDPNPMRWNPSPESAAGKDWIESLRTVCGTGSVNEGHGVHLHVYAFSKKMEKRYFLNADADCMLVPQLGTHEIKTELGFFNIEPGEIALIPRGMKFQIHPLSPECRGYLAENFGAPFRLPELGPIGANGLAHRRHFEIPKAQFEDLIGPVELIGKFSGSLWSATLSHSPLDVVAWHGNYVPYKYDLRKFNTINTVSFDHPDPSIFTVLTSPSDTPGVANADFVIFPPRWMTAETTFRPPYFHRNCMSEYMGLIYGVYDAKTSGGFVPGGGSLHNFYTPHGPDQGAFEKASRAELKPEKIDRTLAFMFETRLPYRVTDFALRPDFLQADYQDCWRGFARNFK